MQIVVHRDDDFLPKCGGPVLKIMSESGLDSTSARAVPATCYYGGFDSGDWQPLP